MSIIDLSGFSVPLVKNLISPSTQQSENKMDIIIAIGGSSDLNRDQDHVSQTNNF